tara:strand:- start:81 stop:473 length:393 start_codon:yes stop_codon:yes gene_type:complete
MVRFFLLLILIPLNAYTSELLFECENGYSYKINNSADSFYKKTNQDWKKIDRIIASKNKLELFIPNSNYLSCSNKDLPICSYSKLINFNLEKNKANVREIVLNDCFIGTMGCNKYSKGLELNQKRCKISN